MEEPVRKKIIERVVDSSFIEKIRWEHVEGGMLIPPNKIIEVLQAAMKEHGENLMVSVEYPGHDGGMDLGLVVYALEPEEVYSARLKKYQERRAKERESRLKKYLELKKEFGDQEGVCQD